MRIFREISRVKLLVLLTLFFVLLFGQGQQIFKDKSIRPLPVLATEDTCTMTVSMVVRNQVGDFVPNVNFAIYVQVFDADRNPKPDKQVATGKTAANTGIGIANFKAEDPAYAIKVWDPSATASGMYFYNELPQACGQTVEKVINLSGIHVVLRDSQGMLRNNTGFKLYTQKYDVDGDPIKDQLVASLNTGSTGQVTTYLTDKARSMDGVFSGYYVFESPGVQGGIFSQYNIKVEEKKTTDINFKFSDIAFTVKDAAGVPFPSGSEVKIYEQKLDLDGEKIFGSLIKRITTNDKGVAVFEYPAGTYAASILGGDGQTYKYYDLKVVDQERKSIPLQTTDNYMPGGDLCSEKSFVNVVPRSAAGDIIPGLSVSLYKQNIDANGVPISGAKAASAKVGANGVAALSFYPDPRLSYILNIYDKAEKTGEFWWFDNIKFVCGEDKEINKTLSDIKVIIRDASGKLVPNQSFSIYAQKYDVDGNPMKEKSALVKALKTAGDGSAIIYVAGDHPYNPLKKGIYAFYLKKVNTEYLKYDIEVSAGEETVFEYSLPAAAVSGDNSDDNTDDGTYTPLARTGSLLQRLKGYILLQVESHGEAWYVDNTSQKRYYMKNGPIAYDMMRKFGLGISDVDLAKIPIGVDARLQEDDTDSDGLPDKMEEALGTDPYDSDSDDDSFPDGDEVKNGYDPTSADTTKVSINASLANRLLGNILLQVESRGEAWYLNPKDGKRYYMKDGDSAYEIMRFLSLGITNQDLKKLPEGSL